MEAKALTQKPDFRTYLIQVYERRLEKNPRYSLRAYAQSLGMHAACLSVILKGKRPVTRRMMERLCDQLGLGPAERLPFFSNMPNIEETAGAVRLVTQEMFAMMSSWHYDAICELVRLEDFRPDAQWIAQTLDLSVTEVNIAVERLVKYEFIEITPQDKWILLAPDTELHVNDFTTLALKKLQQKVLELSADALANVPVEKRYHSSMTMAIRTKDLPLAKEMLRRFKKQFCADLQGAESGFDDVYQLNLGFYPVSKKGTSHE